MAAVRLPRRCTYKYTTARRLEQGARDKNLLRLIRRFLKAGVLDEGVFHATEQGTPQGNLLSPVLSNIYLHYVLDVWFERRSASSPDRTLLTAAPSYSPE